MPEWNNHDYDHMSPEELRAILRTDAECTGQEALTADTLYKILDAIAGKEGTEQTGAADAYARFQEDYLPCRETLYGSDDDEKQADRHTVRWIRSIAAVVAVLLLAGSVVAAARGCELWGTAADWTKDVFSMETFGETSACTVNVQPGEYTDFFRAMDELGIPKHIFPRELPAGLINQETKVYPFMDGAVLCACYRREGGYVNLRILTTGSKPSRHMKDDKPVEICEKGGNLHYIFTNGDNLVVVWMTDGYECSISGALSHGEIVAMIDSMYAD